MNECTIDHVSGFAFSKAKVFAFFFFCDFFILSF